MKFDLHIHTKYSGHSFSKVKDILSSAKKKGLSGIAVTDHSTIRGGKEAFEVNSDPNFLVIVGAEIATDNGDIIGLFLNKEIEAKSALEVIDEIHAQGGLVVLPHPYRSHRLTEAIIKKVDVVEVFNALTRAEANDQALELAQKYNKPMIAGSDAHFISEIGKGVTVFQTNDIKKEILAGNLELGTQSTPYYKKDLTSAHHSWEIKKYWDIPFKLFKATKHYFKREAL